MEHATDTNGVAHLVAEVEHSSDPFAEFADALRMAERLAVTLVNDAALHDVGVTQPRI